MSDNISNKNISIGQQYRVLFFQITAIVGLLATLAFGLRNFYAFDYWLGIVEFVVAGLAFVSLLIFYRQEKLATPANIIVGGMFSLLIILFVRGGIADTGLLWFAVFPILSYFLLPIRNAILWNILLATSIFFIYILERNTGFTIDYISFDVLIQFSSNFLVMNLLVFAGAYSFQREERELEEQLTRINKISGERARLSESVLQQDKDIQEGLKLLEDTKLALLNVLEDVEEEKEKLRKQVLETRRFQQVVDEATDGVIMTTPDMNVTYINAKLHTITGYTLEELVGLGEHPLIDTDTTNPETAKRLFAALKNKKPFISEEVFVKRKDSASFQARISISPVIEKDSVQFFVAMIQDITERKQVERAKTEFVSLASHELRTPLAAVNWYTELLLSNTTGKLQKKQREYLMDIYEGNKRMVELVNALLNVSRLELGTFIVRPTDEDIIAITRDVLNTVEDSFKHKGIQVERALPASLPMMSLDKNLIRMVLQNLVVNAMKYTPEGGKVTVGIKRDVKKKKLIISVIDTGFGIPLNQQDRVFEKLFRADNVRVLDTVGTGLGLYITKSILDNSGGKVWFKSPVKKTGDHPGTAFYVELPFSGMKPKQGSRKLTFSEEGIT